VHRLETYVAGFSHQIGRHYDGIRVPAGAGHDHFGTASRFSIAIRVRTSPAYRNTRPS
jgi:hypothetical protein